MKKRLLLAATALIGLAMPTQAAFIESTDYTQVYGLDIDVWNNYDTSTPNYDLDPSDPSVAGISSFDRVAYYLELDDSWIWVSFDAHTTQLNQLGVPVNYGFQTSISNLNVFSNVSGITAGTGLGSGNIEFFNNCYAQGANGIYDNNDDTATASCYGSMQVFNGTNTLFAFNAWDWSDTGRNNDIGIGNSSGFLNNGFHTDWTFAWNAGNFQTRRLEVFVASSSATTSVPEPSTIGILGLALLSLIRFKKR